MLKVCWPNRKLIKISHKISKITRLNHLTFHHNTFLAFCKWPRRHDDRTRRRKQYPIPLDNVFPHVQNVCWGHLQDEQIHLAINREKLTASVISYTIIYQKTVKNELKLCIILNSSTLIFVIIIIIQVRPYINISSLMFVTIIRKNVESPLK